MEEGWESSVKRNDLLIRPRRFGYIPTAHAPRIAWKLTEQDALDMNRVRDAIHWNDVTHKTHGQPADVSLGPPDASEVVLA
jgi:hypothetical protein